MSGLHLYVHIPFCAARCAYCAFDSRPGTPQDVENLLPWLLQELAQWREVLGRVSLSTLYIGGGTPSLMTPDQVLCLLDAVFAAFPPVPGCETTLEANPDSARAPLFRAAARGGINRVSLGVQSLDPGLLRILGRIHTPRQALDAVETVRKAGIPNISVDAMWGIPMQSPRSWRETLTGLIQASPSHISAYCLTLEPFTSLEKTVLRGETPLPSENALVRMFFDALEILEKADFRQYEIANFARPGTACKHNTACWEGHDYLGIGPGAVSTLNGRRWKNPAGPDAYIRHVRSNTPAADAEHLDARTLACERIMLGLRMCKGLPETLFRHNPQVVSDLASGGFLHTADGVVRLTPRGMLLSTEVIPLLFP